MQTGDWISFELLAHNVEDSNLESLLKMQLLIKLLADSSDLKRKQENNFFKFSFPQVKTSLYITLKEQLEWQLYT